MEASSFKAARAYLLGVHLLFLENGRVLLLRRNNTGYEDGNYGLVEGHWEAGESVLAAAVREAREEAGVEVREQDIAVVHCLFHEQRADTRLRVFFRVHRWTGEPHNAEPEKCDDLQWFPLRALPDNIVPYARDMLKAWAQGDLYASRHGRG